MNKAVFRATSLRHGRMDQSLPYAGITRGQVRRVDASVASLSRKAPLACMRLWRSCAVLDLAHSTRGPFRPTIMQPMQVRNTRATPAKASTLSFRSEAAVFWRKA